jgi:hypothetical protein
MAYQQDGMGWMEPGTALPCCQWHGKFCDLFVPAGIGHLPSMTIDQKADICMGLINLHYLFTGNQLSDLFKAVLSSIATQQGPTHEMTTRALPAAGKSLAREMEAQRYLQDRW